MRAARRMKDLEKAGVTTTLEEVLREMEERDRQDAGRKLAPTKRADDAIQIDSGEMSAFEVVDIMIDVIRQKEKEQQTYRTPQENAGPHE